MILPATRPAVFIAARRYRRHSYGGNHPLGIPRVSLTQDLIRAYEALDEEEYLVSRQATVEELGGFHTSAYIEAMQAAEAAGRVVDSQRKRHNIGNFENPYFDDFFSTPATATGGSIQAAELLLEGKVTFSPAGGMHHAMPDQAHGFCFFNDPALAIQRLRRAGKRVLYLDIDAHHGDGVEYAFRHDAGVVTCSLHMDPAYAYPFKGGGLADVGELGNAVNLPLPKGTNDDEYAYAFGRLWPAVLEAFRPEAVVVQAGTDILMPDPLGKFRISTQCFLAVMEAIIDGAPRHADGTPALAVLGGGGYHPLMLARCWVGVWALLSGRKLPAALPAAGRQLLEAVDWDQDEDEDYFAQLFESRLDRPQGGPVREEIKGALAQLLDRHPLFAGGNA